MDFAAAHPPCGTEVRDELPEGYPVEEGVGLWCPVCTQSWWAQPAPEPAVAPPEPAVGHVVRPMPPQRDAPPVPAVESAPAAPARARRPWLAPAVALAAFVVLAVVVAATAISPGSGGDQARAAARTPTSAPTAVTPSPAVTTAPSSVVRTVTRRVAGRRLSLTVDDAWTVRRRRNGLTATGPRDAEVRVSAGPRRGRSLRRLGLDARRALDRSSRTPLRFTRVGRRRAVAVTAGGQQLIQVADGRRRWLVSRPAGAGARIVRSLRIA